MTKLNRQLPRLRELGLLVILFFQTLFLEAILLLNPSEHGSSVFLGFSYLRLLLIGFVGFILAALLILLAGAFKQKAAFIQIEQKVHQTLSHPNAYLIYRDFLVFSGVLSGCMLYFAYENPRFLEFFWPPLFNYVRNLNPVILWWIISACEILLASFLTRSNRSAAIDREKLLSNLKIVGLTAAVFVLALFIYRGAAAYVGHTGTPGYAIFPQLAEAFLDKRLYLVNPPSDKDLTLFDGKYYVSFPPLGALLMLPKVAEYSRFRVNTIHFGTNAAALTVSQVFLAMILIRNKGWIKLKTHQILVFTLLFGFGTAQFYMATTGIVVHLSQLLAATFSAAAVVFVLLDTSAGKYIILRNAFFTGTAIGFAMLARPHVGIISIFVFGIFISDLKERDSLDWKIIVAWLCFSGLPILLSIGGMFWYNQARFGSPLDFGYEYMIVASALAEPLQTYGQFNIHFIWQNLKANWLGLPYWHESCHRLAPNRQGMSIFITTPALLYLYRSWKKEAWVVLGWISTLMIIGVHLLYYNTGALQFGYRFSLDFLVIMICLLAVSFRDRVPKLVYLLVTYSLVINFIGVLWHAKQWCITW
jgi:hypothetical protein